MLDELGSVLNLLIVSVVDAVGAGLKLVSILILKLSKTCHLSDIAPHYINFRIFTDWIACRTQTLRHVETTKRVCNH